MKTEQTFCTLQCLQKKSNTQQTVYMTLFKSNIKHITNSVYDICQNKCPTGSEQCI